MSAVSGKKDFSVRTSYIVYATPDKVFEALTDSAIISAWGGGLAFFEVRPGGRFEMFDGWASGEVISYKPGKELSYSWKVKEWDKKTPPSLVQFNFKTHPAGTEIFLMHKELPSQEEADKYASGWVDNVFEPLNEYFKR